MNNSEFYIVIIIVASIVVIIFLQQYCHGPQKLLLQKCCDNPMSIRDQTKCMIIPYFIHEYLFIF